MAEVSTGASPVSASRRQRAARLPGPARVEVRLCPGRAVGLAAECGWVWRASAVPVTAGETPSGLPAPRQAWRGSREGRTRRLTAGPPLSPVGAAASGVYRV